jgi:lipid-binding SYLF domain-containing protein
MMELLPLLLGFSMLVSTLMFFSDALAEKYFAAFNLFRQSSALDKFFKASYGYAIFPTVGKAAYVVGGSYGEGLVYRRGKVVGKTTLLEGSIGFQAGIEAFSQIIFFRDKLAYEEFISDGFEFDATAQAVVITAGVQARSGTAGSSSSASTGADTTYQADADYVNGMATFVHIKGGLMYELSIGGQKFSFEPF